MLTDLRPCWNCGFENPGSAKFCANCGKPQAGHCPECGRPVAPDARFCPNCGTALAPQRAGVLGAEGGPVLTAEARKVITAVFVDLVDSTRLTERFDPEEARQIIGKFYDVVRNAVERFEGTVANYLGDAVLAVFGLPVSHEDDPERAVRAALAIREALPVLNEHLSAAHGWSVAARMGINTGEVVAASGSTFDRDFLVADAVTTAHRLQENVPAGSIVVGERTYRLTRDAIEYGQLPPMQVKGKAAPLAAWAALAALPEPAERRRVAAPLIGRHGELGLLRHLYDRTREEGLVQLVTMLGQAGVGKSRVLREFLAESRETDPPPLLLRGRSIPFGGQIGYHALIDILRAQAGLMDTDTLEVVRGKLQQWLQPVLPDAPDLAEGLLLTFGVPESTEPSPEVIRRQLFTTWRNLFAGLAAARPVVATFEDLHWADDGVLDLLEDVGTRVEGVPLFVVCLARPELLERRPRWGGGGRNATTMDLKPLRPPEAEALVSILSNQALPPEMRRTIVQRAEGNPLFLEELVRMLLEGSTPGATIPDTVQAVITARIDRLPPEERRVLQAAAVVGRTFWPSPVGPLAGLRVEDTVRAIQGLIGKELVVALPRTTVAGEREYAFRQSLTRDVAYGLLPRAQRQRAHAETARWLEARLGERVEEAVEILAEHLRLAGDDARAAVYLRRAAQKAYRLYASADSIRLFDQALDLARSAGLPPRELAMIHRGRGEVYQLQADYPAALSDFEQGLAAAREAGDQALEAALENRVGFIHHREVRLEEAEAHFSRAADLARLTGDRQTLGLSLVDLANVAWDRGQVGRDDPRLSEGIDLLRESGDRSGLARGLNLLSMARFGAGEGEDALAFAHEALAAARAAGDKSREATSLSYLSVISRYLGRYTDTLRYGQEALELARSIGDKRREVFALGFIVPVHLSRGDWGEAYRILDDLSVRVPEYAKVHVPFIYQYLGQLLFDVGDVERARGALDAIAETKGVPNPGWQQGLLVARMYRARLDGDAAGLSKVLDDLLALPWGVFVPDDGDIILLVGEALLEAGRVEDARRLAAERRPDMLRWGSPPHLANLAILEALLAARDGQVDHAGRRLEEALRLAESVGDLALVIRVSELRWQWLRRPEDRDVLRAGLQRIAASLPDDLRARFLETRRAAVLRDPA